MTKSSFSSRSSRRSFHLKVGLLVLLILFGWVLLEYSSLMYRSYQLEQKKQWFIDENERLVGNNEDLEKKYEYYKTDYFFRKEAKRKLNKKEPGEQVVIITGGDEKIRSENTWEIGGNVMQKWWDYLFGERPSVSESE